MVSAEILEQAMKLRPEDKFVVVEALLKSLDIPDQKVDDIWAREAEARLLAYREGRLKGIPMEEIFEANRSSSTCLVGRKRRSEKVPSSQVPI